jgi:NAD(P)-dependent dehydrogenase (short-subunit alcohol dehydrogenase family)
VGLLDGKAVVVTGGGGGLGRIYALALAREGASVVVNDLGVARDGSGARDQGRADRVVAEIRKAGGDAVANSDTVATFEGGRRIMEATLDTFGRLDVLVNNAGIVDHTDILDTEETRWDRVIATHLRGTFGCTQAAAREMAARKTGGRIINASSLVGLQGSTGQSSYAAAKAGIAGLTLVAALDLARHGITVNAIVPVAFTRLTKDEPMFQEEGMADRFAPEKVSPVVVYLASELSGKVTGRLIGIQGDRLFAYETVAGKGATSETPWTPQRIHDKLDAILKVG